jgi:hypothetical protein
MTNSTISSSRRSRGLAFCSLLVLLAALALLCAPRPAQAVDYVHVTSTTPAQGSTDVDRNGPVSLTATFDYEMDTSTINSSTFYLTKYGTSTPIPARVTASGRTATLAPSVPLDPLTNYAATIRSGPNGVKSLSGNQLQAMYYWGFITGTDSVPPAASLVRPAAGAHLKGYAVTVEATASDDFAVKRVDFLLDGERFANITNYYRDGDGRPIYNANLDTTGFTDGTHTLTARAIDTGDNTADASYEVVIDNTPPTATITNKPPTPPTRPASSSRGPVLTPSARPRTCFIPSRSTAVAGQSPAISRASHGGSARARTPPPSRL